MSKEFCGMRRPSLGGQQNDEDGDLSRLASSTVDSITFSVANANNGTSRSSTASSSGGGGSSGNQAGCNNGKAGAGAPEEEEAVIETSVCGVTYLPKIIELEWQQQQQQHQNHRKRKERLDSTSSNSQTDRKVIRSNSAEKLAEETTSRIHGRERKLIEIEDHQHQQREDLSACQLAADQKKLSLEEHVASTNRHPDKGDEKAVRQSSSSPSRLHHPHVLQHNLSSVSHHQYHHGGSGGGGGHGKKNGCANGGVAQLGIGMGQAATPGLGDDHYSDGEHERRRSSERFCRSRAPHGRKSSSCSSAKKSSSSAMTVGGGGGGGAGRHFSRTAALSGVTALRSQNVINAEREDGNGQVSGGYKYDLSALKTERRGFTSRDSQKLRKQKDGSTEPIATAEGGEGDAHHKMEVTTAADEENDRPRNDPLPWNEFPDETPVVCPRFAENTFDHVINVSDKFIKIHPPAQKENPIKYVNNENMKTRDIMKKYGSPMGLVNNNNSWSKNRNGNDLRLMIITPEERMKQINGRLTKLKKRIVQYEDGYERDFGQKPGKVDTLNDKAMKTIMTEIQKLKRERQAIKTCGEVVGAGLVTPISLGGGLGGMFGGLKEMPRDSQPLSGDMKINKMQETLTDIETVLQERRKEDSRLDSLEKLSMDQLLQEKTAVQRGLLYLEGIYGRPDSKEERDMARPLYDRYRQIKRMLNRNSSLNSGTIDLPTILEHEAMVFTSTNNTPSTDATPPEGQTVTTTSDSIMPVSANKSTDSTDDSSSLNDNLHQLSITELWHQLDIVRDEKKVLRRTIKDFEQQFEAASGRKMLKGDRKAIEETYALYKQKKGRLRLLDALVKKHMAY